MIILKMFSKVQSFMEIIKNFDEKVMKLPLLFLKVTSSDRKRSHRARESPIAISHLLNIARFVILQ